MQESQGTPHRAYFTSNPLRINMSRQTSILQLVNFLQEACGLQVPQKYGLISLHIDHEGINVLVSEPFCRHEPAGGQGNAVFGEVISLP